MLEAAKLTDDTLAVTVLAEELAGQVTSYEEQGIAIKRIWKRNSFTSWIGLLTEAVARPEKQVLIAFELAMFGGSASLLFFPFLLAALRLFGKNISVMAHHIITDLDLVQGHI